MTFSNFDEIVEKLRTNEDFIKNFGVDEDEFKDYVEEIDNYQIKFEENEIIKIEEDKKQRRHTSGTPFSSNRNAKPIKVTFPPSEYNNLNKSNQALVNEAENDAGKQFIVGSNLIKGSNNFKQDVELGVQYLEASASHDFIEAILHLSEILKKGQIVKKDLEKAKRLFQQRVLDKFNTKIYVAYGKVLRKDKNFIDARKYFEKGSLCGDPISMYNYAKLLFAGEGGKIDAKAAEENMISSMNKGFHKSDRYLSVLKQMRKFEQFKKYPVNVQHILVMQISKYHLIDTTKDDQEMPWSYKEFKIKAKHTEAIFAAGLFCSPLFVDILKKLEKISFEISSKAKNFKYILNELCLIKKNINHNTKIILNISNSKTLVKFDSCSLIDEVRFDENVQIINERMFSGFSSLTEIIIPSSVTDIGPFAFENCSSLEKVCIAIPN